MGHFPPLPGSQSPATPTGAAGRQALTSPGSWEAVNELMCVPVAVQKLMEPLGTPGWGIHHTAGQGRACHLATVPTPPQAAG